MVKFHAPNEEGSAADNRTISVTSDGTVWRAHWRMVKSITIYPDGLPESAEKDVTPNAVTNADQADAVHAAPQVAP